MRLAHPLGRRAGLAGLFLMALLFGRADQVTSEVGAAGAQPPSAAANAKKWPVGQKLAGWPHPGSISSYFGARRGGFHNGLDIAAPYYTPVRAAASGIVQAVGKAYISYGDTAEAVIIAHASDLSTLYGHLEDRLRPPTVRPGQFVQAGQIIGYVGSTGWSTGPHTHFTTIYDGRAVDPLQLLP